MSDNFFNTSTCNRCKGPLGIRITSWFTEETICMRCNGIEDDLKMDLQENGLDPSDFEGCGYLPNPHGKRPQ